MKISLLIIGALLCSLVNAQEKKKITHEDLWLMKRAGAPKVSPDGKWVVYSVTEAAYDEKEVVSDLWMAAVDGSILPRRLTTGKASESGYQWSPDSRHLAFIAKRDGEENSQVYLLNIKEGGETQKLTSLSTGAGSLQWGSDTKSISLQWSPDSKKIFAIF